jgi:hypothetical protein
MVHVSFPPKKLILSYKKISGSQLIAFPIILVQIGMQTARAMPWDSFPEKIDN